VSGRLAILASGSGSNAAAIIDRVQLHDRDVDVACVITDQPAAHVIERARDRKVDAVVLPRTGSRADHERELVSTLRAYGVTAVALAGYMRICGPVFLDAFGGRTINVHPSLLPRFPGRDAIGDAHRAGERVTGVTVHFIDEGVDTGPLVCQQPVALPEECSVDQLARRIHAVEHALFPLCAIALARQELVLEGEYVYASERLATQLAALGVEVGQRVPDTFIDGGSAAEPQEVLVP
jgi:phosphoribosylglycinamide formyltransferase 1